MAIMMLRALPGAEVRGSADASEIKRGKNTPSQSPLTVESPIRDTTNLTGMLVTASMKSAESCFESKTWTMTTQ